jgi:ribosomal protein L15E
MVLKEKLITIANTPQQNGISKHTNRTLVGRVLTIYNNLDSLKHFGVKQSSQLTTYKIVLLPSLQKMIKHFMNCKWVISLIYHNSKSLVVLLML